MTTPDWQKRLICGVQSKCSGHSDIQAALDRIAELESQLKAAREDGYVLVRREDVEDAKENVSDALAKLKQLSGYKRYDDMIAEGEALVSRLEAALACSDDKRASAAELSNEQLTRIYVNANGGSDKLSTAAVLNAMRAMAAALQGGADKS